MAPSTGTQTLMIMINHVNHNNDHNNNEHNNNDNDNNNDDDNNSNRDTNSNHHKIDTNNTDNDNSIIKQGLLPVCPGSGCCLFLCLFVLISGLKQSNERMEQWCFR